jgi:2-oxo-4-hydroxy-4-carboxy-5-ureidoimidazoline decarboxylase
MQHPKIGDIQSMKKRLHSKTEQMGIYAVSTQMLEEFVILNHRYEEKFGYIYLVFAPGKTAEQMLAFLKNRLNNDHDNELIIASQEKQQINQFRLEKLVANIDVA